MNGKEIFDKLKDAVALAIAAESTTPKDLLEAQIQTFGRAPHGPVKITQVPEYWRLAGSRSPARDHKVIASSSRPASRISLALKFRPSALSAPSDSAASTNSSALALSLETI